MEDEAKLIVGVVVLVVACVCAGVVSEVDNQATAGQAIDLGNRGIGYLTESEQADYDYLVRDTSIYLDVPQEWRVQNYSGGSCVHACIGFLFNWVGMPEWQVWWNGSYGGGEYSERLNRRLEAAGVRFAFSRDKDWAWLEACCRLRYGAAVNYPENHMVNLVGIDAENVYLVDNNNKEVTKVLSREAFARNWTGWAVTLVYPPPPPMPVAPTT